MNEPEFPHDADQAPSVAEIVGLVLLIVIAIAVVLASTH